MNEGITTTTRPTTIDQLIGLDHIKNILKYDILGSVKLGQPVPSFIISGPGGTGKSTVSHIIANLTKGNIEKVLGSDVKSPTDLYTIAQRANDGDVIIVEEAHTLNKKCQAVLLEWMENYKILGGAEFGVLNAPKVCFIFPTTDEGQLSKPFRTRCRILNTSYYKIEEMEEILRRAAKTLELDLDKDPKALRLLAQSSRATPRVAVMHRLDMLRKVMAVDGLEYSFDTVSKTLSMNNINPWGLEHNDLKYCYVLYKKMQDNRGRPVAKKIIIQSTGFNENVIDHVIESYLQQIHFIKVESQGRVLTQLAYEVLDYEPIAAGLEQLKNYSVDLNKLAELIKQDEIKSGGMKALAPKLGLTYGRDNGLIQDALRSIGYISKRKSGIVPITNLDGV